MIANEYLRFCDLPYDYLSISGTDNITEFCRSYNEKFTISPLQERFQGNNELGKKN